MTKSNFDNFITVYESISGWRAVEMWWNPDLGGFWEPWQTCEWAHENRDEAVNDARNWAQSEGKEFRDA